MSVTTIDDLKFWPDGPWVLDGEGRSDAPMDVEQGEVLSVLMDDGTIVTAAEDTIDWTRVQAFRMNT